MKVRSLVVAPLVLGATLLGACTPGDKPDPSPTANTPGLPAVPAEDVNRQPREALQAGGELRLTVPGLPASFNPLGLAGGSRELAGLRTAIFPTLFTYDAEGHPAPNPAFLTAAEQTSSSPTTVKLTLNPKAVWGDGHPLDWNDVKATVAACDGHAARNRCATTSGFDQIASVTKGADDRQAVVTFRGPWTDWQRPLTTIVRAESVANAKTFNDGWANVPRGWSAGPFALDDVDADGGTLAAGPNPRWWADAPLLERITWRAMTPAEAAEAFRAGQIDSYDVGDAATDVGELTREPGQSVHTAAGPRVRMLAMNSTGGPLAEEDLRLGIAQALDRGAVATAGHTPGTDWPVLVVNHHLLALGDPGYVDQSGGAVTDPGRARSTIDGSGWKGEPRTKAGKRLSLRLAVPDGSPAADAEAASIVEQLAAVGVPVTVERLAGADLVDQTLLRTRAFDLVLTDAGPDAFPYDIGPRWGPKQPGNLSGVGRAGPASLAAEKTADAGARQQAINGLAKQLWGDMYGLPLYQRPQLVVTRGRLANFGSPGRGSVSWTDVGYLP